MIAIKCTGRTAILLSLVLSISDTVWGIDHTVSSQPLVDGKSVGLAWHLQSSKSEDNSAQKDFIERTERDLKTRYEKELKQEQQQLQQEYEQTKRRLYEQTCHFNYRIGQSTVVSLMAMAVVYLLLLGGKVISCYR